MRLLIAILLFISLQSQAQIVRTHPYYRPTAAPCSPLLLDTYSGAAAAYSLRKLDCDYAGSAIRVRRSSDNTESDIGFTSGGDLDTASLKTFVGTGGTDDGFIVTWYSQTGSNNATQSTSSEQPKIMDNGVVLRVNGKPCVDFGTDSEQWWLGITTGFLNGTTELSLYGTWLITNHTNSNGGVFAPSTSFSQGLIIYQNGASSIPTGLRINNTDRVTSNSNILWNNGTQSLTEIYGDATSMSAYKNNVSATLNNSSAMPSLNFNGVYAIGMYFQNIYDMYGKIQEIIIYPSNKTSYRSNIVSNINTYYSIY